MKKNSQNINKRRQLKKYNLYFLVASLFIIIFLNIISYYIFYRIDLTSEKRYSLSQATKKMLKELDDIVFFKVYLEGKFPAGFKRLHNETKEILDEFRAYSDNIQYEFINPNNENDPKETRNIHMLLMQKGLEPTQLYYEEDGSSSQQVIFPGAIVSYRNKELPVQLLNTQKGVSPESVINNSIQTLEYNFAHTIKKLTEDRKQKIGFLEGHGELDSNETADIFLELSNFYLVKRIMLSYQDEDFLAYLKENNIQPFITTDTNKAPVFDEKLIGDFIQYQFEWLKGFDALIIAKPNEPFSERDKFIIDQFLMNGGKIVWLIDPVYATMDSLMVNTTTMGFSQRLNLDDQLFKYGVRINSNLIQDLKAVSIPLETGRMANQPQYSFLPWFFFPVIMPESNHPIVKNLNMVKTEFVSSIDIIEKENITATALLNTSQYSRTLNAPVTIDLNILRSQPDKRLFNKPNRIVAVLLEGTFESLYKNRLLPPSFTAVAGNLKIIPDSKITKQVIISDGDIIKNQVRVNEMKEIIPLPLGYDKWTRQTYGNKDFIMNVVNYLCDDSELIQARAKEFRLRLLDKTKIAGHKMRLQILNTLLPVLIVLIAGIFMAWKRRNKYL